MNWTVRPQGPVPFIDFDIQGESWDQEILITSDRHWDNPKSDHALQIKHLEYAKDNGLPIIDAGDLFCIMQGKYDPRKSLGDIRPEHDTACYLDAVLDTSVDFFKPYAKNFAVLGRGNHELSQINRNGTDLTSRFCQGLKAHGSSIVEAGIGGYIMLRFKIRDRVYENVPVFFHHGTDTGSGVVTKGTTASLRRTAISPDARVIFSGHNHEHWVMPIERYRVTRTGKTFFEKCWVVNVPTYKQEYKPEDSTWHCLTGKPPKPIGAVLLKFQKGVISTNNAGSCINIVPSYLE